MSEHARCGCGGEVDTCSRLYEGDAPEPDEWQWCAVCTACNTATGWYTDAGSALEAWDRAMSRPTIPSPSECRDPERLALIRPETVERWMDEAPGWMLACTPSEHAAKSQGCCWVFRLPDGRNGSGLVYPYMNQRIWADHLWRIIAQIARAIGVWEFEVLADLEALQTEEDGR